MNIMATEQNPFELEPIQPVPQWGGMAQITPQGEGGVEGSYFSLSPEAMQMMWAPQTQQPFPQPQVPPPLPPQV
jgi:hypothetical protein